ncbi:MAG: hypothetical protein AAF494_03775 [Pseudomonadota bacterium]
MSGAIPAASQARDWSALTKALDNDHVTRLHLALALFMFANFLLFLPAWLLDPRMLDSASVWTKPQKFNLSLSLHFLTLAVLFQMVPREIRNGPSLLLFSYLAAGSLLLEYVWVGWQAAQAKRSHFNYDTPFEAIMYGLMGVGAFFLVAVALALAVQIWRKGERSGRGLWLGAILGLSLSFAVAVVFGFQMSSSGRYVGAPLEGGGATIPFFGWSREYGDLRPSHFVGLHMMQTLPLIGWVADRLSWRPVLTVTIAAAAQTALTAALFYQAMNGQPFWPV